MPLLPPQRQHLEADLVPFQCATSRTVLRIASARDQRICSFPNYSPTLPIIDLYQCVTIAMNEASWQIHLAHGDVAIGTVLHYNSGSVRLQLRPFQMTWALWAMAMRGMKLFIFVYEPVALNLGVTYRVYGIGFGLLTSTSQPIEMMPAIAVLSLTSRAL